MEATNAWRVTEQRQCTTGVRVPFPERTDWHTIWSLFTFEERYAALTVAYSTPCNCYAHIANRSIVQEPGTTLEHVVSSNARLHEERIRCGQQPDYRMLWLPWSGEDSR